MIGWLSGACSRREKLEYSGALVVHFQVLVWHICKGDNVQIYFIRLTFLYNSFFYHIFFDNSILYSILKEDLPLIREGGELFIVQRYKLVVTCKLNFEKHRTRMTLVLYF